MEDHPEPGSKPNPPGVPPSRNRAQKLWTDAVHASNGHGHEGELAETWTDAELRAIQSVGAWEAIRKTPPNKLALLRRDFFDALGVGPR